MSLPRRLPLPPSPLMRANIVSFFGAKTHLMGPRTRHELRLRSRFIRAKTHKCRASTLIYAHSSYYISFTLYAFLAWIPRKFLLPSKRNLRWINSLAQGLSEPAAGGASKNSIPRHVKVSFTTPLATSRSFRSSDRSPPPSPSPVERRSTLPLMFNDIVHRQRRP